MSLRIQLLGQPRITLDGNPVDLPGYRPLALLAYLLLTKKAHRREDLVDLLFDGPDDPQAALRWTLSKLRKALGSEYLLADRQEVSFNLQSDYWLDVFAFEAGEIEQYRGNLLEGLYLRDALRFEDWLLFERERLRGKVQAALEQQLEQHKHQGDPAAVVITTQELLKLDHLREDWHYALIEAYAQLGKRAAALEQYEKCRQMLKKEWGVDPAPETASLAEAVRTGQIGARVSPSSSEPGSIDAPHAGNEQVLAPVEEADSPHRPRVSRPSWAAMGVLGLFILVLLVVSSRFDLTGWAVANHGEQGSTESGATQTDPAVREFAGKSVWILGPFTDDQAKLFVQSIAPLEARTGIDVVFLSSDHTYELDLAERLEKGDLPDIIAFPQPSWLIELAEQGKIVDIGTFIDDDYLQQQYPRTFLELVTVNGRRMGVWHLADIKSLVWYPKRAFEAQGYEVPETWDELIALTEQIAADGATPWCIGIESGDFSGWVGTDWVEDILLRTAPPETYDAWVRHELPFDSPKIRRVFEIMGQIWLNDDYVYGGAAAIPVESFSESPAHLFEDPPGCYLHRQASFAPFFFPQGVTYGRDYDFFYLPPIDPEFGKPVLGSGNIFAMVKDRPEVREVVRYLTTAESTKALIENGGYLSPHRDTPLEWFPTTADLRFAQIVLSADTYRFDASDLMPGEVGLGSFYRGIIAWVQGADLETVLHDIDRSWPP